MPDSRAAGYAPLPVDDVRNARSPRVVEGQGGRSQPVAQAASAKAGIGAYFVGHGVSQGVARSKLLNAGVAEGQRSLVQGGPEGAGESEHVDEIVQFTAPVFYCKEGETTASVDVMRIGRTRTATSVRFATKDVSAQDGIKYIKTEGILSFDPGEVMKSINIPIVTDENFDTTTEFSMHLHSPENCFLGAYLCRTRIFILDDDIFPSNKYKAEIESGTDEALANISIDLLVEYMRFTMMRVPTIFWKTVATAFLDQLWNLYYLFTIYIQVYLVDVVLHHNNEREDHLIVNGNRHLTAIILALLYFAPNLILLAVGRLKRGVLDMSKPIRVHLQVNLFRQYLNYTEESKHLVQVQDLTTAMDSDIPMVVEDGYMFCFDLMRGVGKVLVVAFFMMQKDPRSLFPLVVYPTVMFFFIRARQEEFVELESAVIAAEAGATGMLVNAVQSFGLIRDYKQRNAVTERYEKMLELSKIAHDAMVNYEFWNERLVPWMTLLGIGLYMAIGAQAVLVGQMTVGSFLAMIHVYKELGDRFEGLYNDIQSGVRAGSPLVELTRMMSLPTDVGERMQRNRMRRQFMQDRLEKNRKDKENKDPAREDFVSIFDEIPIVLDGIRVPYIEALGKVDVEVQPSTLIYITGHHRSGKGTLVRALTDVFIPPQGHALYSSHNRCLHVPNIPEIMPYLSLYENLTFGWPNHSPERVRKIFTRLGMGSKRTGAEQHWLIGELEKNISAGSTDHGSSATKESDKSSTSAAAMEKLEAAAEADLQVASWHSRLSYNERKMIHLARALIYNPEVLVLHRPNDDADVDDLETISTVLREFVDQRGIELPASLLARRRPRTCFFSGNMNLGAQVSFEVADEIWWLSHKEGLARHPGGRGEWHRLPHFNWIKDPDSGAAADDRIDNPIPPCEKRKEEEGRKGAAASGQRGRSSSPRSSTRAPGAAQAKARTAAETSQAAGAAAPQANGADLPKADGAGADLVQAAQQAGIFREKTAESQSSTNGLGHGSAVLGGHAWDTVQPSSPRGLEAYADHDLPPLGPGRRKERNFCDLSDRLNELRNGGSRWRDGAGTPPPPDPYSLGVEDTDAHAINSKAAHRERWCQMKMRSCS